MVEFSHAVICVSHCNQGSVRGGDQINQAVVSLAQVLFEDDHCKDRGACRDISRTFCHGVCGNHSGSRVSFWRCKACTGFELACRVKDFCSFRREASCIFACKKNFRKQLFELPGEFFTFDEAVEFFDEVLVVVLCGCVNREHSRGIADSKDFFA